MTAVGRNIDPEYPVQASRLAIHQCRPHHTTYFNTQRVRSLTLLLLLFRTFDLC